MGSVGKRLRILLLIFPLAGLLVFQGCGSTEEPGPGTVVPPVPPKDSTTLGDGPIDFTQFNDFYGDIASPSNVKQWRHYNVHDPSIVEAPDFYYMYSTDVAYGASIRPGLQIRRSKNLVEWEFYGWVFSSMPPKGSAFIQARGGSPLNSLWAPYIMKVGDTYRCYYSLASTVSRLSVIGLATSDDPRGPFIEQDIIVTSLNDNTAMTNAIDPTVIVDQSGEHWMYYGSSWDGIYRIKLDAATGLNATPGNRGVRVAHRGFSGGIMNGNIEAPEIIYNEEFNKYYLFIAYDWLETKYNVRVGRSDNPDGPFYDMAGNDLNQFEDNAPMIIAPYQFNNHPGWQGVSHPSVFKTDGDFYIAHQGRPGNDIYYMILHLRQLHWTEDGWPVASPERYATEEETLVGEEELAGEWELISFGYNVVPGFADEQTNPDFQSSETMTLDESGTINGNSDNSWEYEAPWLYLTRGPWQDKLYVERGRDWENSIDETILFTGFNQEGTTIWGKKMSE